MIDDYPPEEADLIKELWQEHLVTPFPKSFKGMDVSGIDFVMLDADIAGCVGAFIERGTLDVWRTAILGLCYHDCEYILPVLNEEVAAYYWRLGRLAELILKSLTRTERPAVSRSKEDRTDA